jgi:N-acetylmuramoyl-L-alanine amidase
MKGVFFPMNRLAISGTASLTGSRSIFAEMLKLLRHASFLCFSHVLFGTHAAAWAATQQELIPIVREIKASSAPSVTEWKTFFRTANYDGASYVSLVQVSELLNGKLYWHAATKSVDLFLNGQKISFLYNMASAQINGRSQNLDKPTIKNADGFWVPIRFFASPAFYQATKSRLLWPVPQSASPASVLTSTLSHSIRRIVIDPGHGGKDPGAVGPHGLAEKDVNLLLAQELAEILRESYGYEVLLTRMDDTFIPLEERAKLANRCDADLFISLHCNASTSSKLKGFEVYFLSETASDPHADAVARLENAVLSLEGKEAPSPNRVKEVLRSLVKNANINEASALGSLIDRHLAQRLSEPSLGVKQAAFYVLRGAEMPAVLIETGFVSNVEEERLLQSASFRKALIQGISAGIAAYDNRKVKERTSRDSPS